MKKSNCIYIQSFYYAAVYAILVCVGFLLSYFNNVSGFDWDILNVIGFGTLIVPTLPFQALLFDLDLMVSNGEWIMPSDEGIILSHTLWFAFFYAVYFAFLKWGKCLCACPFKKSKQRFKF